MNKRKLSFMGMAIVAATALLAGCDQTQQNETASNTNAPKKAVKQLDGTAAKSMAEKIDPSKKRLAEVLAKQPEKVKDRYVYRHPQQTLEFFGIKPGMTVVEALPGGGYYSKILLDYLGENGKVVGADYAAEMFPLFGFFDDKFVEAKKTWVTTWTNDAAGWREADDAQVDAFQFGSLPDSMKGTADAVLFIRALHNLARFESNGEYFSKAMKDTYDVLKPGGIVGVVQHMAPESNSDEWASGKNGYLKKSFLIKKMKSYGFTFVGESDVNVNPADNPTEEDMVWRLPPTLVTSRDNPELKTQMEAIGESSRMTLLFAKPAAM